MAARGMINAESLLFNLKLVPALLLGALAGILLSRKLTNQAFRRYITILTAIAAALLFLPPGKLTELFRILLGTGN